MRPAIGFGLLLLASGLAPADTSPRRRSPDYAQFTEVAHHRAPRAWYLTGGGRYLAVQAQGGVTLLDTTTGREHGTLRHPPGIHDGGFSADGRFLATSGNDGTVRIWEVAALREVRNIPSPGGFA